MVIARKIDRLNFKNFMEMMSLDIKDNTNEFVFHQYGASHTTPNISILIVSKKNKIKESYEIAVLVVNTSAKVGMNPDNVFKYLQAVGIEEFTDNNFVELVYFKELNTSTYKNDFTSDTAGMYLQFSMSINSYIDLDDNTFKKNNISVSKYDTNVYNVLGENSVNITRWQFMNKMPGFIDLNFRDKVACILRRPLNCILEKVVILIFDDSDSIYKSDYVTKMIFGLSDYSSVDVEYLERLADEYYEYELRDSKPEVFFNDVILEKLLAYNDILSDDSIKGVK